MLFCDAPATCFSAPIGHFQGGHLQRNKFIINADKCVHKVKIQCYQLKWCYNVKNLDYLRVFYSS